MTDSTESKIQELLERNLAVLDSMSEKLRLTDIRTLKLDDWERKLEVEQQEIAKANAAIDSFEKQALKKAEDLATQARQLEDARTAFRDEAEELMANKKTLMDAVGHIKSMKETTIEEMKEILLMIELGQSAQDIETHIKTRFAVLEPQW